MNSQLIMLRIRERIKELQDMKHMLGNSPSDRTGEHLYWKTTKGKTRYYLRKDSRDSNGKYLGNKDKDKLLLFAEKYRNRKYLVTIDKEISLLNKCLRHFTYSKPEEYTEMVWENLPDEIKSLTVPAPLTDEGYAGKWQNKTRFRKKTVEESPFRTMRGEYVRSKSECIIADRLYLRGIPYHYEINHTLVDEYGSDYTVQPDFTVLNKRTREEFIWEHFGKMGDSSYCNDNLPKLNDYVRSGYIPGRNLILSFESLQCPLNVIYINAMIEKYLL